MPQKLSHQGKEKFMVMSKGFGPSKPAEKSEELNKPKPISIEDLQTGFSNYFDDVPDPRVERTKQHLLKDILVIALLAVIAGADGWEDMENYGISKLTWLQKFLKLPNGIPSDDTFRRVFEKLDPKMLEQKLAQWINQLIGSISQEVIPIDGKSLRGSYDRQKGVKNLHLVTAWA
ncbi:ISAs1 family transposase, partial [Microcoleus sp. B3-A4]|uniref:ISAs1 family transposase n=1 Tax=Microcoleus sp. B3-A4 TaxID=2818653 RepID=UPI002FD3F807